MMLDKTSVDKINEIKERLEQGATYQEIMKEFNVASSTIKKIKDMLVCPKCGHNPPVGSRFCNKCGEKLLTPNEQMAEKLKAAAGMCAGSMYADEIRAVLFDAAKYLEKLK